MVEVVLRTKWFWFSVWLVIGLGLDQGTKAWVQGTLAYDQRDLAVGLTPEIHLIDGWLSLVHAHNTGAAFSMMEGMHYLFLVFTVIATLVVADMLRRLPLTATFQGGVLGLLISGAWGNGLDRVRFGYVVDFVKVYTDKPEWKDWLIETFGTSTYPIFNVADAALLIGVGLFAVQSFMMNEDEDEDEDVEDEETEVLPLDHEGELETEEVTIPNTEETEVIEP